jgi:pimeloyl-ACP methyl ester carboxylesterase
VKRLFRWFLIVGAALLLPLAAAYAFDRLLLAPVCPACHVETAKSLPLFDPSREGLVRIRANGMEFRARVAGFDNRGGEGVILLHGFPETSIMWEPMLDKLARAGFRVVAFDQRGYSPGARPFSVESYRKGKLAADVVAVATAVGFDRFHVVGHDWGGIIAWIAADRFPREVISVTSLSAPHPQAFADSLAADSSQLLYSSYVPLTWLPVLPELALGFDRAALLQRVKWQLHPAEEVEEYKRVFSETGALRAALNWYRAFKFEPEPTRDIRQPALFIWGNEDPAFGRVAAEKTADHVKGPFRFDKLKAGHWLMLETPDLVMNEVLLHLQGVSRVSEQWNLALAKASPQAASSCDEVRPHCLSIFVTPNGDSVRIRNRCEERYRGVVRLSCSGWTPDAFVEYRFNLGAKGDVIQENNGLSFGECYYSQQLCSVEVQDR